MKDMKISTQNILKELATNYPDQTAFRKNVIESTAKSMGYTGKDFYPMLTAETRVKIGTYDLSALLQTVEVDNKVIDISSAAKMQSIVNEEKSFAKADPTFVPWGAFHDVVKMIKSQMFYPVYVSGLSGNGKTFMVEQACSKLNREFIRVQINPETDEDDLLGGFRLINGETVFSKGPVLKAMENGAILLLDEIDRATNKIMCLQGILEGKPPLNSDFKLYQNYPNPFNPITALQYDLTKEGVVNITIYDMMGRLVKTLVDGPQTAGFKTVQWDATNDRNEPVSAGLYLYTMQKGKHRETGKMVLIK